MKMGETQFRPGEWRVVNATGQDLKAAIMPIPMKEPSNTLMELLKFLLQAGKELASVAEIFTGKMPGQNTPATTTMATIEQGSKIFTAVHKRVFRALTREFRKLYILNKMYLDPKVYVDFLDHPMSQEDFTGPDNAIVPAADPSSISQQEKQVKVQAMMQLMPMGVINPMEFAKYYLDAFEIPAPETFLMQPQPQPDPEMAKMEKEAQIRQAESQQKMIGEDKKHEQKLNEGAQKAALADAESKRKIREQAVLGALKVQQAQQNASANVRGVQIKQAVDAKGQIIKQNLNERGQRQKMRQQEELHRQKLKQQAKEPAKKGK
jgi:chaperonin GroES